MSKFNEREFLNSEYWGLFFRGEIDKIRNISKENQQQSESEFWFLYTNTDLNIKKRLEAWNSKSAQNDIKLYLFSEYTRSINLPLDEQISLLNFILKKIEEDPFQFLQIRIQISLGYNYLWQGKLDLAMQILHKTLNQNVEFDSTNLGKSYLGHRLFAELAQVARHKGDFQQSLIYINQSLKLSQTCNHSSIIAWVIMVKVGILTESLIFVTGKHEYSKIRDGVKHDLARIEAIREETHSPSNILQYIHVAKYQYLKSSKRNRDRVDAERIIETILQDPQQHWIHKIDARQHLADLLVQEYKLYEQSDVLAEINYHLKTIEENAMQRKSVLFLVKAKIIRAKLLEIHGEFKMVESVYKETLQIASSDQLGMLTTMIELSQDRFNNNFDKMEQLIKQNSSISERMELNKIQNYLGIAKNLVKQLD